MMGHPKVIFIAEGGCEQIKCQQSTDANKKKKCQLIF